MKASHCLTCLSRCLARLSRRLTRLCGRLAGLGAPLSYRAGLGLGAVFLGHGTLLLRAGARLGTCIGQEGRQDFTCSENRGEGFRKNDKENRMAV